MTSLSDNYALTATFLVAVLFVCKLHSVIRNPLTRLPGPEISKWTHRRLQIAVITGDRVHYVHALHEQYGPVVRISPREVSLADAESAKTVNRIGSDRFVKSPWYESFGGYETKDLFSQVDPKKHAQLRKLVSINFSERWIRKLEPFIARNTRLVSQKMAEECEALGYTDVFKWFFFMASDILGESAFGESFGMLEIGKKTQFLLDLENFTFLSAIRAELPTIAAVASYIPWSFANNMTSVTDRLQSSAEKALRAYERQLNADPDNVVPTLLTNEYKNVDDGPIPFEQLRRDAIAYIVAGTDTTAVIATYAVWHLIQYPDIEEALIREAATLPENFNDDDLKALKLLDNVISETLRLSAAVAQSLPRIVPTGGAQFGGHYVPGGATVGVQTWTLHRDPLVWHRPDVFNPARWESPSKDMRESYVPWGGGSSSIGIYLAQLELRHALANFYRKFESGVKMSSAEGFTKHNMMPVSFFLMQPRGHRCLISRRK